MNIDYILQTCLNVKNTDAYICMIYLFINDAKNFCRSTTLMKSILRSLNKSMRYYIRRSPDYVPRTYHIDSLSTLYEHIFEGQNQDIRHIGIYYKTPNNKYGKSLTFTFHSYFVDSISESSMMFDLPKRITNIFEDYLHEYIKEDRIRDNRYDVCNDNDIEICIDRKMDLKLSKVKDSNLNSDLFDVLDLKNIILKITNNDDDKKMCLCKVWDYMDEHISYFNDDRFKQKQINQYKDGILSHIIVYRDDVKSSIQFRRDKNSLYRTNTFSGFSLREEKDPLPLDYR